MTTVLNLPLTRLERATSQLLLLALFSVRLAAHPMPNTEIAISLGANSAVFDIAIAQGVEMGRPSAIGVQIRKAGGAVEAVRISGRCVPMMQGTLVLSE